VEHKRLPLYKGEDKTGKYFGKWIVLEFCKSETKGGRNKWKCLCTGCNREFLVNIDSITLGKSKSCKSCVDYSGSNNHGWKGYKNISGSFWYKLNATAKNRNIEVNITIEDLQNEWENSGSKCSLTGLSIELGKNASVDRIDSKRPYESGNIQWVHKDLNKMKMDLSMDKFLKFCTLVSKKYEKEINNYWEIIQQTPNWQLMLDD
jgi:hypothetical protein